MFKVVILVICLLIPEKLFAREVEIGGLLLDNTISRQGREFYYKFSQFWQDIPNSSGINVQVKEQVIPRSGTKLSVHMNNNLIYVTYMGRRQQPIKNQVEAAVYALIEAMAQSQMSQSNPDLADNGW